jgi:trans-aconitate 2-methyltransferase
MSDPGPGTYTFGDSDLAIERLDLMARLFAPSTVALLDRWGIVDAAVAVDLGCGPGNTTELIAARCGPRRLVAVDASDAMVAAAARRLDGIPGAEARVGDVTAALALGPVDLAHARYLLAHLTDPFAALDGWCAQLAPGGRVLVDEIDAIDTTVEPFRRYLDTVETMLRAHGTDLYVGRALSGHRPAGARVLGETRLRLPQPTATVARMFSLNLAVWRREPWAVENRSAAGLDDLARDLDLLAGAGGGAPVGPGGAGDIVWTHRQVAWERTR